ncbi:MAG: hypothetical protein GDA46_01135 [Bdellovibrionales bacterium]|nr:hypothetical protein [Bdellovibrionales bacterium]
MKRIFFLSCFIFFFILSCKESKEIRTYTNPLPPKTTLTTPHSPGVSPVPPTIPKNLVEKCTWDPIRTNEVTCEEESYIFGHVICNLSPYPKRLFCNTKFKNNIKECSLDKSQETLNCYLKKIGQYL